MADGTAIEWTHRPGTKGETWNPVVGCDIVSPGCIKCYAMRMARRIELMSSASHRDTHYAGTTRVVNGNTHWTGKVVTAPHDVWQKPLRWKSPRTIFVNSMSDLFHPAVEDSTIDRVFATAALTPQHVYIILTKRSDRMRDYVNGFTCEGARRYHVADAAGRLVEDGDNAHDYVANAEWPLPNVWLGVSAERQQEWDERVPSLERTPAAVRFVSIEPMLSPIDCRFGVHHHPDNVPSPALGQLVAAARRHLAGESGEGIIDWIIVGGESGPDARPMHPAWARQIRDQCAAAGVAFFFKQWGSHRPLTPAEHGQACGAVLVGDDPHDRDAYMLPVTKKAAGRLLDGVEHNAMPSSPLVGEDRSAPRGRAVRLADLGEG